MDGKKVRMGEPGYDPSTLWVPESAYKHFTPAERQYWDHKKVNADLTLFFKVGKFYEMFDEDAEVGVRELSVTQTDSSNKPNERVMPLRVADLFLSALDVSL